MNFAVKLIAFSGHGSNSASHYIFGKTNTSLLDFG